MSRIPTAKLASGGSFVNCRCFYCPDGSSPDSKHFYIAMPKDDEPAWYYCHKCHCSGLVTHKTLIEWGIFDQNMAVELNEHITYCGKKPKNQKYYDRTVYSLTNTFTQDDENSRAKLAYINNRLGYEFTYAELKKLKIVLNLKDLLLENRVTKLTRHENVVDQLDANFLGFISIDNAFLNMRKLCADGKVLPTIDKRYINYKVFDKFDTSERFYTVPTEIDLNTPERIKIHISEGPFDILSVYKNLRHEEKGIYSCVAGSNYVGLALYFLQTFKIPFTEFHFYPDNDKFGSNAVMQRAANILAPLQSPIYIHRNTSPGQKDFGVSPE